MLFDKTLRFPYIPTNQKRVYVIYLMLYQDKPSTMMDQKTIRQRVLFLVTPSRIERFGELRFDRDGGN